MRKLVPVIAGLSCAALLAGCGGRGGLDWARPDEFAVARTKMKFTSPAGSSFNDHVLDSITVFHQEAGVWKIWSDEALGVQFLRK